MKKIVKLLLLVCLASISFKMNISAAVDNVAPKIIWDSFSMDLDAVDTKSPVEVQFELDEDSDMAYTIINVTVGGHFGGTSFYYDLETKQCIGEFVPTYAGPCEILSLKLVDVYGNESTYINSAHSKFGEPGYDWGNETSEYLDMSQYNFVVPGYNENDTEGPEVVFDSLSFTRNAIAIDEMFWVEFSVEDESEIAEVYCNLLDNNGRVPNGGTIEYNEETGKWGFSFLGTYNGILEIRELYVSDINGNKTWYINSTHSNFGSEGYDWGDGVSREDCVYVDMSDIKWKCSVGGGHRFDMDGPDIYLDTFSIRDKYVKVNNEFYAEFQVGDESGVTIASLGYIFSNGEVPGNTLQYDATTKTWMINFTANYVGLVEMYDIEVTDVMGNKTRYINSANSRFGEDGYDWGDENTEYYDLSEWNFYVGVKDINFDIFISGDGVTDESQIDISHKDFRGHDFDKMKDHKHKPHGFYDIRVDMEDVDNPRFMVYFDVPWARDGDKVHICHMRHDGSLQSEFITAKNGKVGIYVSEFSPFLVEENISDAEMTFIDVPNETWYTDSVNYVFKNSIMTGLNQECFGSTREILRSEFAVMLYRLEGSPEVSYMNRFPDVEDDQWYTDAIMWASSVGVVNGYDNGSFGVADSITREQLVTMLYRYVKYKNYDIESRVTFNRFNDGNTVSDFAKEPMKWGVSKRIISGANNGVSLNPHGNALRVECATIFMRFMEKYGL